MDKVSYRNFLIVMAAALICFGTFSALLISSNRAIENSAEWVSHSNKVILSTEQGAILLEQLLSSQRGFLLTGNRSFYERYTRDKETLVHLFKTLQAMVEDNPYQLERLGQIRDAFMLFTAALENRAHGFADIPRELEPLTSFEMVDKLRDQMMDIHDDIIDAEQELLSERIADIEDKRDQYFLLLLVGGIICAGLLTLQGSILFHARTHRNTAEKTLKETEARFTLASEGANDGIFDWDIAANTVFYSRPFFTMLGYDRPAHIGTFQDFTELVHPEDLEKMWSHVERYLKGEISEYAHTFRMRHNSGRWLWINSRASAMYDATGKPYRMVGAHTDITYMKEYQDRLQARRDAAEKANRAKTEFLAHMSHEIRTPLTAISGIAEILERQREHLSERVQKLTSTLSASTATLKDLINDILDFAKIESGEMTIDKQTFAPADLFEQVYQIMSIQAREKNLDFSFDYTDFMAVHLSGDPLRLRQILINLIGNAIKFTDKGFVKVSADLNPQNRTMYISVKDSGIGIKSENFEDIFLQFHQGDSSASRRVGGTGLGLAISRNLARLMGGDISVESVVGEGTTFTLSLPATMAVTQPKVEQEHANIIHAPLKKSVLIAEDYDGNVVVLSYLLEEMGLDFDVVNTGSDAVRAWQANRYDLILMDVQMPEMDGLSATQAIRVLEKRQNLPATPIIGMTAHALVGDRDKCIKSGMSAYLAKPLVEAELKAKIAFYLDQTDGKNQAKTA